MLLSWGTIYAINAISVLGRSVFILAFLGGTFEAISGAVDKYCSFWLNPSIFT